MIPSPVTTTLFIQGLGCGGGDARTAERALARVPGVVRAYVNPLTESAYVAFEASICSESALRTQLQRAGFRAVPSRSSRLRP